MSRMAGNESDSFQWRFSGATVDGAGGFEARTVARAIPGIVGGIPVDDAFHVRADG